MVSVLPMVWSDELRLGNHDSDCSGLGWKLHIDCFENLLVRHYRSSPEFVLSIHLQPSSSR